MNKLHIAGTGVGAGFIAVGIGLFFPRWNLTAEQLAFVQGLLPVVAMGAIAAIEVMVPKSRTVITAFEQGVAPDDGGGAAVTATVTAAAPAPTKSPSAV